MNSVPAQYIDDAAKAVQLLFKHAIQMGYHLTLEQITETIGENVNPPVDLRKAKRGDGLVTKSGLILRYVEPTNAGGYYDHYVAYPNGSLGSRLHNGFVFRHKRLPEDEDIIAIIPAENLPKDLKNNA